MAGLLVLIWLLAMVFGDLVVRICASVVVLCALQGLWRGAAELVGLLAGTLVAILAAPSLGRACEGLVSSVVGTGGLVNRFLAIAAAGGLIIAGVTIAVSVVARRVLGRSSWLEGSNRLLGMGLGAAEGIIIALAVLWIPLTLEPVAAARLAEQELEGAGGRKGVPGAVMAWADAVRGSALGGVARGSNPIGDSKVLKICRDFAAVSRSDKAMAVFLDSDVMTHVRKTPSVEQAMAIAREDPALAPLLEGRGVSASMLREIMESPAVLRILDETTLLSDVGPMTGGLEEALRKAKASLDPHAR